jgi:hypothetical protein
MPIHSTMELFTNLDAHSTQDPSASFSAMVGRSAVASELEEIFGTIYIGSCCIDNTVCQLCIVVIYVSSS